MADIVAVLEQPDLPVAEMVPTLALLLDPQQTSLVTSNAKPE